MASTSSPRRTTRRSATSTATRLDGRRKRRAPHARRRSPAGTATTPRADAPLGGPHLRRRSATPPPPSWCACPSTTPCARWWPTTRCATRVAGIARRLVEFFRVDAASGVQLDGWLMSPAGLRLHAKVPGALPRLRRAGGPDGDRQLGRERLPVAPDADPAGVRGGVAWTTAGRPPARPRVAEGDLPEGRRAGLGGPGRRRARVIRAAAVRRLRRGSASGGGAAAGR